jgi:hypothetical protein
MKNQIKTATKGLLTLFAATTMLTSCGPSEPGIAVQDTTNEKTLYDSIALAIQPEIDNIVHALDSVADATISQMPQDIRPLSVAYFAQVAQMQTKTFRGLSKEFSTKHPDIVLQSISYGHLSNDPMYTDVALISPNRQTLPDDASGVSTGWECYDNIYNENRELVAREFKPHGVVAYLKNEVNHFNKSGRKKMEEYPKPISKWLSKNSSQDFNF